jgi:hypothetical protein
MLQIRVGNFRQKKLFRGRLYRRNNYCLVTAEFRLFRGTEKSRNSVPNRSAQEKNARNSVPWNKKIEATLEIPFRSCIGRKYFVCRSRIFCKANFFMPFPSVPSLGIDTSVNLGMSTFFRRITETIPSLFHGFFS